MCEFAKFLYRKRQQKYYREEQTRFKRQVYNVRYGIILLLLLQLVVYNQCRDGGGGVNQFF
jgi:predicted ABC-type exoprotein transport system permease subunit